MKHLFYFYHGKSRVNIRAGFGVIAESNDKPSEEEEERVQ